MPASSPQRKRVEHYEIAGYGTARTYARILANAEAEQLLQQTLDEEKETNESLYRTGRKRSERRSQSAVD